MKKIVIANWKMNPLKSLQALKLVKEFSKNIKKGSVEVVVCPPFPFLGVILNEKKIVLGAQNISSEKEGSFTGEVSGAMLKSLGVSYVIVGHSERRAMGETSDVVAKKARISLEQKLSPIICIGEKARDQSAEHWQEIKWQLVDSLQGITKDMVKKCIIAYEPLWAISKKNFSPMKSDDVSEASIFIKKILAEMYGAQIADKVRIIYGGSVNDINAKEIINSGVISGLLVGKSSLNSKEFGKIIKEAE